MWIREREGSVGTASEGGLSPESARLRSWVKRLAVPRHRFANRSGNRAVRDVLADAFGRLGLEVRLQGPFGNVVALPPGSPRRALTFVAAHYDTVPDCPGADDNASGLAVMLECARVLAARAAALDVGYIAFNGEEDGLLGSRDFVKNGIQALPVGIGAVHVLEMVGYRRAAGEQAFPFPWMPARFSVGDFLGLLAKGKSNALADAALGSRAAPGLRVVAAKTWGPLHRAIPDLTRSDHFPFWRADLPSLLWTDTGNFRNPNYHLPSDTPDTLDYEFMTEVATLLAELVEASSRTCRTP